MADNCGPARHRDEARRSYRFAIRHVHAPRGPIGLADTLERSRLGVSVRRPELADARMGTESP
jgi:hypothetical protein